MNRTKDMTLLSSHDPFLIPTNVLTKFYEDRPINVANIPYVENCPIPMKKFLTEFHLHCTKNVTSRVLTRNNAQPTSGHVFRQTITIFEFKEITVGTNSCGQKLCTDGRTHGRTNRRSGDYMLPPKNVWGEHKKCSEASRVSTRKNALPLASMKLPPPCWPCFSTNRNHFHTCPKYQ
ncbi:hypothetical protein DPMN_086125 [Dreissena polymorpha]|uniref:Uncharacterized protein n=1 Tax=Dreissena polymorpha TaxID=45954 RepID=A0A9D3YHR0_DREPO|nr:hypothetical protein DPMN_086125 [Dreissena polymorpha]